MLIADALSFHYALAQPGETLDFRFDLQLAPGECLAVDGPSGAGKSTLLSLLAGFLTPASGRLLWSDQDLTALPPWERDITTVFQDHNLFDHLPVWANVGLGLAPNLRLSQAQHQSIGEGLAQVGLEGLAERLPTELSGGQRQRVALIRALLRQTRLLLLDEPFSGLDRANRELLWQQVQRLKERGVAVMLVSHDTEDITALADRRLLLADGRLKEAAI
ncbi:ATP-binding cassette domain-containing protein [Halomonas binhaiensis]|uniref:ATP-binding cassette domain-containing protein n=1 Tax=Halomonas binhaiensis TaxID=2562282 RepID=A0A5C1NGQ8_9GAMM|nr:ATP-binding cassette domain-containing protein [Halomonas binhaiensis]QEM80859.1 ATP-binding cassette domain-containing protein [Halomonas binhaiensis]